MPSYYYTPNTKIVEKNVFVVKTFLSTVSLVKVVVGNLQAIKRSYLYVHRALF